LKTKRLTDETCQALAQRVVKPLDMCGLSRFFSDWLMLLIGNDRLIGRTEIGIARSLPIDPWNSAPQLSTRGLTAISERKGDNLAGLTT
jgi:hypothetical protein